MQFIRYLQINNRRRRHFAILSYKKRKKKLWYYPWYILEVKWKSLVVFNLVLIGRYRRYYYKSCYVRMVLFYLSLVSRQISMIPIMLLMDIRRPQIITSQVVSNVEISSVGKIKRATPHHRGHHLAQYSSYSIVNCLIVIK